ncbi:ATP-binding protein [Kribbella sp. NPDC026611]|uniref:ATP-binding protein n=1 Tax=Kribbella sp. NPDC026611 TaxID=3154911 RepID=UPI00340F28B2
MTAADPRDTVVAVAIGDYAGLQPLPRAVPDTTGLVELLRDEHGFATALIADRRRGDLLNEIDVELAANALPGAALVVLWTGHAVEGPAGNLLLMARASDTADGELAPAGQLGLWAARTGASQVLVILDACYSGKGVPDAYAMANAVLNGRADPGTAWFGVVAASRGDEPARSGAMARALTRLFTEGPSDVRVRQRWNPYAAKIRGDDLIDALVKEWPEPRQTPQQTSTGDAQGMLMNPLHRRRAGQTVVEHLQSAARSTTSGDDFFTGREAVLARVVSWLRRQQQGLCVVTGPPGSGKSAVVGRVVSLSVPQERQRLNVADLASALDPGESSVDVQVHARGLTAKTAVRAIADELGLDPDAGIYDVLAHASRQRQHGKPLVVFVDGLDEAGEIESREIAVQLLVPLAKEALVLVGTREVPGPVDEAGLLALLGTSAELIDLGADVEQTLLDIRDYTIRRLDGISAGMDPHLVADELVTMARDADPALEGPFLFARLVTSQLRVDPVETVGQQWRDQLASSVEKALEYDLQKTVMTIAGQQHPTAARELLHALTYAHGTGMPVDDVWPAVATAISPTGTQYTRDDCYALLLTLGRHVVTGAQRDQAVYRLAHQRLADHLRLTSRADTRHGLPPDIAVPIAEALTSLYGQLLDEGQRPQEHGYLWLHTWRHCADAGVPGIELLRPFVGRDRNAFLPDLAEALDAVVASTFLLGAGREGIALAEELVSLRRELDDPIDLATGLFELATTLTSAGEVEGADRAALEAVEIARAAAREARGDPIARTVLGAGLTTHALTQLRQGNLDAASHLALEAVALFEEAVGDDPELAGSLASACTTAARAALLRADLDVADELSLRALEALRGDLDEDEMWEAVMLEAHHVRALVEMVKVSLAVGSGSTDIPVPASATAIVDHYRKVGGTGTISDVSIAEGLRLLAITTWLRSQATGSGVPEPEAPDPVAPDPVALLDEAITLVSAIADRHSDGVLTMVACLVARATILQNTDPAQASDDLAEAERRLRSALSAIHITAGILAEAITLSVSFRMATGGSDLAELIDRQYEAADLFDTDTYPVLRDVYVTALRNLWLLLGRAERSSEATEVLSVMAEELRQLQDGSPRRALTLAGALVDLASSLYIGRPLEAAERATEALDVLRPLDGSGQLVRLLRGLGETTLSATSLILEREAEARTHAKNAVELLEPLTSEVPVAIPALTTALNNLLLVDLLAGDDATALEHARRALSLVDQARDLLPVWVVPQLRINLGRALRGLGHDDEATEMFGSALVELRALFAADSTPASHEETLARLAYALNAAGAQTWDVVLADLATEPEEALRLALYRNRPEEELPLTIATFLEGLHLFEGDTVSTRLVRELARMARRGQQKRFDEVWTEAAGSVPDWLAIDPSLSNLVVAWWNAEPARRSCAYLAANPELLDPATDVLIEELRELVEDDDRAELLLQLRRDAAEYGVETAYAPVLAAEIFDEWLSADDFEQFLADHRNELLAPEVAAVIGGYEGIAQEDLNAVLAVLTLTRRDESVVAFRILDDPEYGLTLLKPAWRSGDPERLVALAGLCFADETLSAEDRRLASVALAMGHAMLGNQAEARELATALLAGASEDERADLIGAVADALAYQATQQDALIDLLRTMRTAGQPGPADSTALD